MGSKYPVLTPHQIIKVLTKLGFEKVSQKGSHVKFKKLGNQTRIVIIPMHDEVAKGTLKSILEQAGIDLEEFLKYLPNSFPG
ncbi:MAG: type II toxin-antitoxin system HicA family toxin [Clostridia bacterium]|jgi:predicted RNA binding protein YcfA (HicA-like mRNA interferase family)|uniref:type II toxin-antitoxin system HicA family toxin n=1 Tax=Desulfitibacter alkalitolerans TaxID=264641 RepID=UPI0004808A4B|nr:type II toxin-antitoxin system HicA family toxin [Desulfitibacter alkalitolerans]MBS3970641.1 type II toxin-antitoxin system HicA family toxin [Clostridia bacterium]